MHKAKTSKIFTSIIASIALAFGGVVSAPSIANAAACGGTLPTVTLVTDPIMYSALPTYDANFIGYKITRGSADRTSSLTIQLNNFSGSRVGLAPSQPSTQTVGALTSGSPTKYVFFLAKLGTASATPSTHDVVLTDGAATCTDTTTLNPATSVNPAATSNNSNKVESVTVGTAPSSVGGTITVTVKGDTGQVGTNEGISFAPISNSSFPADKWILESSSIVMNQSSSYTGGTDTFTNRLYLPYTASGDLSYSTNSNLGTIDGKYTAVYTFKLVAATGSATQMKPIQYVGSVYTGSMPAGAAPTITATGTAAVAPAITPSNQTITGTAGSAITATTAFTPSGFSAGAAYSYAISPSLPSNLSINATTGVISGTPSAASATATYTVTVTNTNLNSETATANVDVTISAAPTPTITPSSQTISATSGTAISASTAFTASNFTGAVSYAISPALPSGLSMNTSTGVISGTTTAIQSATSYTVTATDATAGSATATVSITVSAVAVANSVELDRKVTICHRTHSETNPYVRITVDYNSVNKKSGHQGHDEIFAGEHVFKAGIYKRAKDKDWGDIIPADPTGFNRWQPLNWTPLGELIYKGTVAGCPAFDAVKYYNALRESGVPEKKIKQEIAEIETEQAEAKPEVKKTNITELKYTGTNTKALEEDKDKVTICHRTNSTTNPYVRITVAASSIYKNAGHYGHDEIYDGNHVFDSTVNYPNNKKDWGDIIPADPTGKNRWTPLNMTTLGKKIYDGTVAGCAEKTMQQLYNELREEGKSKKEIKADLEKQKNLDEDPKDLDELEYTGSDPKTQKTEPKEPTKPANVKVQNQSLTGSIWLDINKDGLKDPDEPFVGGIEVTLIDPATNETSAVKKATTDADGFFIFEDLKPGDWKVTAKIPTDLEVTYDSYLVSDGEAVAEVPAGSSAYTWIGLVGQTEQKTFVRLARILSTNPEAIPVSEVPSSLRATVLAAKRAKATGGELAATGTADLAWFYFGILMMLTGVALRFARTKQ